MSPTFRRCASGPAIIIVLAALCWLALGCGLIGGDQRETEPTPEPDLQATISAALQRASATQQATESAAAATPDPAPAVEPTPEPTPMSAPTVVSAAGNPSDLDAVLSNIGPDTRWGEVFDAFTGRERACIRAELGEEMLAEMMDSPIFYEGDARQSEAAVFGCLSQETAAALFPTLLFTQMGLEVELNEESSACIEGLLADADIPTLVASSGPDATPQQAEAALGFFLGMTSCISEMMGSAAGSPSGPTSAQDETRLWAFAASGWVTSAPAVIDGVVYVGSSDNSLYALDAATGSELWSFATEGPVFAVPAVNNGVVYVASDDNHLYALDAAGRALLWRHDAGYPAQSSPTAANGVVFSSTLSDGEPRLVALDASSGNRLWTAQQPHPADPEFSVASIGSQVYAAGAEYGQFHAFNAATGETAWTASVGSYVESAPTVRDGVVYLTVVNEAYALDEMTGAVIWRYVTERFPARDFPALVVDGVYYLSPDNILHALDADTGEPLWSHQAAGPISSAPTVTDGMIFAATENGQIFALDASTGVEIWTLPTGGMGLQALTVADGVLYVESDLGLLLAISARDGTQIREFEKGYILGVQTYAVHDGVVYFPALANEVHAHSAPRPK